MKKYNQKELLQVFRFVLVGGVCAGFDFLFYAVLVECLQVNYLLSSVISTFLAIVINYFLTKKWVFSSSKYSASYEFVSFLILSFIGLLLNLGLIYFFVEQLQMNPLIGKLLAIFLASVFNFVTKKKLVFGG